MATCIFLKESAQLQWAKKGLAEGWAFAADRPPESKKLVLRFLAEGFLAWPDYIPEDMRQRIRAEYGGAA